MEPPHHMFLGGEEECQSSESGWTMYIGSPINPEDDEDDDDDKVDFYQVTHQIQGDAGIESDDSMVSDASSGPTHYGDPLRHFKKKVEEDAYHDDDDEVHEYYCYDHHKKGSYKKEKQIGDKKVEKKQKGSVQGGGREGTRK
ncbi:protein SOB FIVE-LIKE 4-like [Vicia villosa]|uniref:protein SOB FIVE-LIKE 4-like n=1 Tax=Vicia villosa TaxID=3911 RepID=UPI00273B4674|nr:protein SOB FIVE-LIKE 4-like [Vicia villosa]